MEDGVLTVSKRDTRNFYVVWKGRKPGVYGSWEECLRQVDGYPEAKFKSFSTQIEAQRAWENPALASGQKAGIFLAGGGAGERVLVGKFSRERKGNLFLKPRPTGVALTVDGACNMRTGVMEYRCVQLWDGKEVFRRGPFPDSTNNVGEFLALVEALALCNLPLNQQRYGRLPIYSDSVTALSWVRDRVVRTKMPCTSDNEVVRNLIARALIWLKGHTYENPVLKWETREWGEIPADFGRK